jgi:hypothetical protein
MIPTSIDGTDITGATIDGTDVQEITVDGQTVFTAGPTLPVGFSNLVAWYPFDSATYGGSNADDVTAIIGGSGDDTAYNGTVFGATYQSSGGVTDINAGANSGAFDFPNNTDKIDVTGANVSSTQWTIMAYYEQNGGPDTQHAIVLANTGGNEIFEIYKGFGTLRYNVKDANNNQSSQFPVSEGSGFVHTALRWDNGSITYFSDGTSITTDSLPSSTLSFDEWGIGNRAPFANQDDSINGLLDDVRIYNTALSDTDINQIYQNIEP